MGVFLKLLYSAQIVLFSEQSELPPHQKKKGKERSGQASARMKSLKEPVSLCSSNAAFA